MKIRMLGTGYGECKTKKAASKDYRKNGGVLIDDTILIDAPLDIFEVADELGISDILTGITDVFISHSHPAHFHPDAISRLAKTNKIRVYATRPILSMIESHENIIAEEINPLQRTTISSYEVVALPTNHTTDIENEQCLNFLFLGDKNLFYALDGGWINQLAFSVLKQSKLDAVIIDTALEIEGTSEKNLYHNDIYTVARIKEMFASSKITQPNTKFILSHLPSPRRRSIHDELSPIAAEHGLTLAYDGFFAGI